MSIYVDDLMEHGAAGRYLGPLSAQAERVGARNGHRWCHLFSDEQDPGFPALHAFAAAIGMRRAWFQGDHYDLTPARRAAAVRVGAQEVTRKEAVVIWRTTPRARRLRCRACGFVTAPVVERPASCPKCGTPGRAPVPAAKSEGCCGACDAGLPCEASSEPSVGAPVPAESATKAKCANPAHPFCDEAGAGGCYPCRACEGKTEISYPTADGLKWRPCPECAATKGEEDA